MDFPVTTGFSVCVTVDTAARSVPASMLTSAGTPAPVRIARGGLRGEGWALTAEPEPTAGDGRVTVLLAGELYHVDALREAVGPVVDSVVDPAELLLGCWQRYGVAGLRLLDGRFAAMVLDGDAVVAATDHAGSVPLYLRCRPGSVELATEAKALRGEPGDARPEVPGTAATPAPASGVRRVRAGSAVTILPRTGEVRAIATWRPPEHRIVVRPEEAVRRVRAVLGDAVRTRLGGGEPTAVISGGIDSGSVAALARRSGTGLETVSLGTDTGDEFAEARLVADTLGSRHSEVRLSATDLVHGLPWAVAASEMADADVLEYLLPLVALYRALPGCGRRIVTGYGADIPLGGMHRATERLDSLDERIATDMAEFDGFNELSPVLGLVAGHWTTHPYWDRAVLELLTCLEPGLKRRDGRDKWVLREAMRDLVPQATVERPKLGIHESSGTTSGWTALLVDAGVARVAVPAVKARMASTIHRRVVGALEPPDEVSFDAVLDEVTTAGPMAVAR